MFRKIFAAIMFCALFSGCTFTVTRTDVKIYESSNVKVEVLQEQKSDTAQSQNATIKAI